MMFSCYSTDIHRFDGDYKACLSECFFHTGHPGKCTHEVLEHMILIIFYESKMPSTFKCVSEEDLG